MRGFPAQIGLGFGLVEPVIECDNTIESALYQILATNASVSLIVADRIFPNIVPAGQVLPAITYQQISGPHEYDMEGVTEDELHRYQLICWAESYDQAKRLACIVEQVLDNFKGDISEISIEWIDVGNTGDVPQLSAVMTRFGVFVEITIRSSNGD